MAVLSAKLTKNNLPELAKRLKALSKQKVSWGWYSHQHYSGMTAASLAKILHNGTDDGRIPPRPLLHIMMALSPIDKSPLRKELRKYFSNINKHSGYKLDNVLTRVGSYYQRKLVYAMGKEGLVAANNEQYDLTKPQQNTPLVYHGDLKSLTAFKKNNGEPIVWR